MKFTYRLKKIIDDIKFLFKRGDTIIVPDGATLVLSKDLDAKQLILKNCTVITNGFGISVYRYSASGHVTLSGYKVKIENLEGGVSNND